MRSKRAVILVLCLQLVNPTAWAADLTSGFSRSEDIKGGSGNIFVSGSSPGAVLMKVNLWGAVSKSGIHYIPPRTDFVTLLSYAGGPFATANLEEVYIKRQTEGTEKIIHVNIKDLVGQNSSTNPIIEPNDIIVVPQIEPIVSDNTMKSIGIVTTFISLILLSLVIEEKVTE